MRLLLMSGEAWSSRRPAACILVGLCAALGGCVLDDPRAAGVVVMDEQALSSTATLEQHTQLRSASALPLLVDADGPVTVRAGDASKTFTVDYGELVHVQGAALELARYRLDRDVYRDRLEVTAPRAVVDELAAQMSAEIAPRDEGSYELRVADAFAHLAQLDPAEVSEVRPVVLAASGETAVPADRAGSALHTLRDLDHAAATSLLPPAALDSAAELDPVGVYHCDGGTLSLDAADRFHSCALGAGRYRIQGRMLTLETSSGQIALQLQEDGSLSGRADMHCTLGTVTEETP